MERKVNFEKYVQVGKLRLILALDGGTNHGKIWLVGFCIKTCKKYNAQHNSGKFSFVGLWKSIHNCLNRENPNFFCMVGLLKSTKFTLWYFSSYGYNWFEQLLFTPYLFGNVVLADNLMILSVERSSKILYFLWNFCEDCFSFQALIFYISCVHSINRVWQMLTLL